MLFFYFWNAQKWVAVITPYVRFFLKKAEIHSKSPKFFFTTHNHEIICFQNGLKLISANESFCHKLGKIYIFFVNLKPVMCPKKGQFHIHCGENSQIFRDAADQTLPVTEFSKIYNWKI